MGRGVPQFVTQARRPPFKRPAAERAGDFRESHVDFTAAEAAEQSARCSQCGVPFCQSGCPLHNDIPDWLRLTAEGRLQEAWARASATSALPEICGRICPQDRLCEGVCVLEQSGWDTVTIGGVERYLGEVAWANGWVEPIRPAVERGASIGIIGAGPAGLAAADRLRTLGYGVTVYDRHDRAGGLLTYGIPGFKLEKPVVERRVRRLQDGGVDFVLNCDVGADVGFAELRARHAAVLVATGAYAARRLAAPGRRSDGVLPALDYLIAANRIGFGDAVPGFADGRLNAAGKDVVVIGGGDTAMDCVRTAVRQGARSVTCLYRRDRENMPGSRREVQSAEEEGVRFEWLAAPRAVLGDAARVAGVRAVRMRLGAPDLAGRRGVEEAPGSEFDLPAQMVIEALGFEVEDLPARFGAPDLATTHGGRLLADRRSKATSLEGVYAAGDAVRGAALVVWAVRDGQDAAAAIHRRLQARTMGVAA
jgi:glutamate synthase (NADPH/NADH) small chain